MAFPNKFPKINQELLSQLRGLFFSKDNPVILPNNGFIGLHSIDTPATLPPFPYRYLYIKADGYGYILDYNGVEYRIMSLDSFGNLIIDNDLTINNNLIVLGTSTFRDSITVNGNVNITGEYQINGYNTQSLLTPFLDLPGKVGIWYAGDIERSTGNINEAQGKALQLTRNPALPATSPSVNYLSNGIAYINLDGTGDFYSRADETDLDVLGTEAWAANPGVTLGGWFWVDVLGSAQYFLTKLAPSNSSYRIQKNSSNSVNMVISANGTTEFASGTTAIMSISSWYFVVGRFIPSTEIKVWLNGNVGINVTAIPASIYNGNAPLNIGAVNNGVGGGLLNGRYSIAFLCANALNDATIQSLFHKTKSLYGVS